MSAASSQPHAWTLTVSIDRSSDLPLLHVRGRAGTAGAEQLRAAIDGLIAAEGAIALDLGDVDYISSAGLNVLQHAARTMHGRGARLEIVRASEAVRLALRLHGQIENLELIAKPA